MRKFFIILAILTIFSCKKSSDSSINTTPEQSLSYKLNGLYREFKPIVGEELFNSSVNAFPPYTLFYSFGHNSTNEAIGITLVSTTYKQLTVGDYYAQYPVQQNFPNGSSIYYPIAGLTLYTYSGIPAVVTSTKDYQDRNGDFSKVTITKIENGFVSGTFSASVTLIGGTQKLSITEGSFTNFKKHD
jgi:hypothetical protein